MLKFDEDPDYNYLRGLIGEVFEEYGLEYDLKYDWMELTTLSERKTDMSYLENAKNVGVLSPVAKCSAQAHNPTLNSGNKKPACHNPHRSQNEIGREELYADEVV